MAKKISLALAAIVVSIIMSTLLGQLALRIAPFGHMTRDLKRGQTSINSPEFDKKYGDPLRATVGMVRLTAFVLDPIVAVIVGMVVGFWGGKGAPRVAFFGMLPLAAFSVYSYPWLWEGLSAGLLDLLLASGTAYLTCRYCQRKSSIPEPR